MYKLNYDIFTGKVCSINKGDSLSININSPSSALDEFLEWNSEQKTPLDLNSTIPVAPPAPVRDLAKELDELKAEVEKLKKK